MTNKPPNDPTYWERVFLKVFDLNDYDSRNNLRRLVQNILATKGHDEDLQNLLDAVALTERLGKGNGPDKVFFGKATKAANAGDLLTVQMSDATEVTVRAGSIIKPGDFIGVDSEGKALVAANATPETLEEIETRKAFDEIMLDAMETDDAAKKILQ